MKIKNFEEIPEKKKYALNNSYFKNRKPENPSTPLEVLWYYRQHLNLPYAVRDFCPDTWLYDCHNEYQKRKGVLYEQFFTPKHVANEMLEEYAREKNKHYQERILEPCCGYGQITREIIHDYKDDANIMLFDIDQSLIEENILFNNLDVYKENVKIETFDFTNEEDNNKFDFLNYDIISNPPYSLPLLPVFLNRIYDWMGNGNIAVLLLPYGITEHKYKKIRAAFSKFDYLNKGKVFEDVFFHTKIKTQIITLQK